MSQTAITLAFEQWKASQSVTGEPVLLDEFVFASVPGLDATKPIDRNETLPPDAQIVHRQAVSRKGVVNENAVVHSVVLGADVGDFSFNWIGLINKASNTLAMIVHAPLQQKLKTKDGQQGNVLTRSFLMEFNGAQTETGINTPAETWQIDFTARMAGMDERQRLENIDIYGAAAFFGDGYLVGKNGSQYFVAPGVGYVRGLRTQLVASRNIVVTNKPVKVWLDVAWTGTLTSAWAVESKMTVAEALGDYVRDGVQHFVFAVAGIDANGNITDLRPKGTLDDQAASDALKKHEQSRNHPDASTSARGFTQLSSATDSDSESLAATPKAVKAVSDDVSKLKKSLGTAATKDVQESRDDTTAGRVLVNGGAIAVRSAYARKGEAIADASGLPVNSVSFCYADAAFSPGYEATILDVGGLRQDYRVQYAASYADGGKRLKFRTLNGDNGTWGAWTNVITNYGGTVDYLNSVGNITAANNKIGLAPNLIYLKGAGNKHLYFNNLNDQEIALIYATDDKSLHLRAGQGPSLDIGMNGDVIVNGSQRVANDVRSGINVVAGQGVYESGGAVRVYSSNNPPPLGAYATIDWVMHNFITDVALGAEGSFLIAKNAWQRAPAGCVLTGYNAEGNEPVNDTLFYRPIQKHIPSYGWINVGHTA
ncbi:phage tail protein [Enterobacter quasiroggenkampii]|uniref:phage tail-collar fiber domain-containing protein n=1 Tax=Enterobacter quasiroggenkampii TaxID=2497436 RepID=UPI0021D2E13C|nr:phage tail protein [Enterobacter quasiroggenkampii]MCU6305312.1 phage tail protein [Enterobacter quasiroggenkampii]